MTQNFGGERDLGGKTFLITGASSGIGHATAMAIAERGGRLCLAGRSQDRTQAVIDEIRSRTSSEAFFIPLELGDLASVRACAERFLSTGSPLHVLINNAGTAGQHGLTRDGFELAFGTNHLGHFLLTELLLDRLKASSPSRIVNVSSKGHYRVKRLDFEALKKPTRTRTALAEYNVSKLCNVLHAEELARRLQGTGVTTYALHPGVIASEIWREVPWPVRPLMKRLMKTNEQGAETSIYCATAPELAAQSGRYYDGCQERRPSALARDETLARQLWNCSVEWAGIDHSNGAMRPAN